MSRFIAATPDRYPDFGFWIDDTTAASASAQ